MNGVGFEVVAEGRRAIRAAGGVSGALAMDTVEHALSCQHQPSTVSWDEVVVAVSR